MLRILLGPRQLRRVAALEEVAGLVPNVLEGRLQLRLLNLDPLGLGDRFPTRMLPIKLVELGGPHGKHRAAFQHLDADTHLEHVGRRSHGHVRLPGLGEHLANGIGASRFDAGLVHGTGDDVGRSHGEGRSNGGRSGDAARQTNPRRHGILELSMKPISQRQDRGKQRDGRAVVRVAAAVRFNRHVVGHGIARRQLSLLRRHVPRSHEFLHDPFGRRREELGRHLDPRHLRNDAVHRNDDADAGLEPGHAIADDRRREVEVSTRLGQRHAAFQEQFCRRHLVKRFAGAVDQVHAVGRVPDLGLDAVDGFGDAFERQPGRTEATEHPGPAHFFDDVRRGDAVGHRAGHVRELEGVIFAKGGVAELARRQRRQVRKNRQRLRRLRATESHFAAVSHREGIAIANDDDGFVQVADGGADRGRIVGRRGPVRNPMAEGWKGLAAIPGRVRHRR